MDKNKKVQEFLSKLSDEQLNGDFDEIFKTAPKSEQVLCCSSNQNSCLQKFATKKWLVFVYGLLSLVFASVGSYFGGTITTLEKRFKIPSKNLGIISTGNDISSLVLSAFISYYGGKQHRPRFIGLGLFLIACHCFLNALPHFVFGGGSEAIELTQEYGNKYEFSNNSLVINENEKLLCRPNLDPESEKCVENDGNLAPQILLFVSQLISGIGQTLCSTLGISYLDDNVQKSKVPAIMSISFFMRLCGPVLGYTLASFCLSLYIDPFATPTINNKDRRWLGAWWLGWIIFAVIMFAFSTLVALFPRDLPRAFLRKKIEHEKQKRESMKMGKTEKIETNEDKATLKDMLISHRRLLRNKLYMLMNLSGILHLFGFLPYWIYTPKYIETIYHKSASASSFYTGTMGIVATGFGALISGLLISKFKPSARTLTFLHVIGGVFVTFGVFSYAFLGCDEMKISTNNYYGKNSCSRGCHCEVNPVFSPTCGSDQMTYISPCFAGCRTSISKDEFGNCSCSSDPAYVLSPVFSKDSNTHNETFDGFATIGNCEVDCQNRFAIFLGVMCLIKFIGSLTRTGHYIISIRSIEERDKTIAMGLGFTFIHLFALIPSPILFGWILDNSCEIFGKSCSGKSGNCWIYNEMAMKYALNFTAAFFIGLGTIADIGVWRNSKNLKIFDDDDDDKKDKKKKSPSFG